MTATQIKSALILKAPQLIDVFSHKTNLNLVLEYLDSDLEQVIKDKSILFMPADIKSWMLMMLRGLDHCHRHFVLHRVGDTTKFSYISMILSICQ